MRPESESPAVAPENPDDKSGPKIKPLPKPKKYSGSEFVALSRLIEEAANSLSQAKLEELKAVLHRVYKKRFRTPKEPKYGSISKAFTEAELQRFFRSVKNYKFLLLFKYQAYLGLRVGEVSKLHVGNIDFDKRELTLKSEKSGKMDSLLIPMELFKETVEYIAKNEASIKVSNGYIFYKGNDNNHNNIPHVDVNYVRKVFRDTLKLAALDEFYGYSEETDPNKKERKLYRLSTHSLRHYAITRFSNANNGNVVLTSRYARHASPTTTMRYIAKDNEQLYKEIVSIFISRVSLLEFHTSIPILHASLILDSHTSGLSHSFPYLIKVSTNFFRLSLLIFPLALAKIETKLSSCIGIISALPP